MKVKCLDCNSVFKDDLADIGCGGEPDEKILLCPVCHSNDLERTDDDETYTPRYDFD